MSGEPTAAPGGRLRWTIGIATAVAVAGAGTWVVVEYTGSGSDAGSGNCVDVTNPKKSYRVSEIDGELVAISANGRYLLGTDSDDGPGRFTLWRDDEPRQIEVPIEAEEIARPIDVNDSGVVVGTIETPTETMSTYRSWRYEDGEFTTLSAPDGYGYVEVAALNDNGTIVGHALGRDREPSSIGVKWQDGTDEGVAMNSQGGPGDSELILPTDISDDDVIVGTFEFEAWVWPGQGRGHKLSPQPTEGNEGRPTITGDRIAAGNLLWESVDGDHTEIGGESLRLNAIDRCGRAYGTDSGGHGKAIVTDSGKPRKLPQLAEPAYEEYPEEPEFPLGEVTGASADGSILIGESNGNQAVWRHR